MVNNPTISVCMIVKNEEANLPRLLTSVQGLADEVVVVDTGSSDRTVEIAGEYEAKVYHFAWRDDFSAARNESLVHATMDYVLWLDGDDEIAKEDHDKIREHLKRHQGTAVFLRLKNVHGGEETEAVQLRMFPNHKEIRFAGRVHEQVYFSILRKGITFTTCDATVIHHGYTEKGAEAEKFRRNKRIHEQELLEDPDNPLPYFFLGRALKGLDETDQALRNYLTFIEAAKKRPDILALDVYKVALLEAAEMYCGLEKWPEALSLLETSRAAFPDFRLFAFSLGQLYFQRKEYKKTYDELVGLRGYGFNNELVPVDVRKVHLVLHRSLGISALFIKDFTTATECLKECVRAEPRSGENYNYLALAYEKSGDPGMAAEVCSQGLAVCPGDSLLKKRRFLCLVKNGDLDAALSGFEMLNGNSGDSDVLSAMFFVYCTKLDAAGMARYYRLLQQSLCLSCQSFPEGLQNVKDMLVKVNDIRAKEFLELGISHLLKISA